MLIAMQNEERVQADEAVAGFDYFCPDASCCGKLRLRKRKGYVPHFYHLAEAACPKDGESRDHETAKIIVQSQYLDRKMRAELEVYLSDVAKQICPQRSAQGLQNLKAINRRCDVLIENSAAGSRSRYFAVEVQGANLEPAEFNDRIHDWNVIGVPVVWIALTKPAWQKILKAECGFTIQKTTLRNFELQMARRYGHIWYLNPETRKFYRAKVSPHMLFKNPTDYFDQNAGEMAQGGGYPYPSERWYDLVLDEPIHIDEIRLGPLSKKDKKGVKTKVYDWCKLNPK